MASVGYLIELRDDRWTPMLRV